MRAISIKCKTETLIQPEDLLSLRGILKNYSVADMNKTKQILLNYGFILPIYVWQNKDSQYIIDGVVRVRAILALKQEGYECAGVPVLYIEADDIAGAKRLVLASVSRYARMNRNTTLSFIKRLRYHNWAEELELPIPAEGKPEKKKKTRHGYELRFNARQAAEFRSLIEKIRSAKEDPGLTAELIVLEAMAEA